MSKLKQPLSLKKTVIILLPFIIISGGILLFIFMTGDKPVLPENYVITEGVLLEYNGSAKTVYIPEGVTQIADRAFHADVNINKVIMPKSLKNIGHGAFSECVNLKTVEFNDGLEFIGEFAFANTVLETVVVPKTVTTILYAAFSNNAALQEFQVHPDNGSYLSLDGVLYNKAVTVLHRYPSGKKDPVFRVPDSVCIIEISAFDQNVHLYGIELPEGLEEIKDTAFSSCTVLREITLPQSVKALGVLVFSNCTDLETVRMSDDLEEIPLGTFDGCVSLKNVNIPKNALIIGSAAFRSCRSLERVDIPPSVEEIADLAFLDCEKLIEMNLKHVKIIGYRAFIGCHAMQRILLSKDAQYSKYSFDQQLWNILDREEFVIENGVLIEYNGFDKDIIIPEGVREITPGIFYSVMPVKITFPKSYNPQNIRDDLGAYHSTLTDIQIAEDHPTYKTLDSVVFSADGKTLIFYPQGRAGPYVVPTQPKDLVIGDFAFTYCIRLTDITLGDNVIAIGEGAFNSTSIRELFIPSGVRTIGELHANHLRSITVDENNPNYASEDGVLYTKDKTKLLLYPSMKTDEMFIVPEGVGTLIKYSFMFNRFIKEIQLPNTLRTIGDYAFIECENLRSIYIPDEVLSVGTGAFMACRFLESVRLPSGLATIKRFTFASCRNLKTVTLPLSVMEIESEAFVNCYFLTDINLKNVQTIGMLAFHRCFNLEIVDLHEKAVFDSTSFEYTKWESAKTKKIEVKDGNLIWCEGVFDNLDIEEGVAVIQASNMFVKSISIPASYISEHIYNELGNYSNLESVYINPKNKMYTSIDGVVYTKNGKELVFVPRGRSAPLLIPNTTQKIRYKAINDCNRLEHLEIPDTVTILEHYAIFDSAINRIDINQRIERQIDVGNFFTIPWYNEGGFIIENNVVTGYYGVGNNLSIPEGVIEIADRALEGKGPFENIRIPKTVTKIGHRAFANTTKHLPFMHLNLTVTIPDSVTKIGTEAFAGSSIGVVYWPYTIPVIPEKAFSGCQGLWAVHLPETITGIENGAFENCTQLQIIYLPKTTAVAQNAFEGSPFEKAFMR